MGAAEESWPDVMDLLTAAKYLRVHPVTLRDWKRQKKGPPGKKMEGRWRFHKPTLDAYLAGTKEQAWPLALTNSFPGAKKARSTSGSQRQTDKKYLEALGLQTEPSRPSGRQNNMQNSIESPALAKNLDASGPKP